MVCACTGACVYRSIIRALLLLNKYDCIVNDGLARIVNDGVARVIIQPHMIQPHRGGLRRRVKRWASSRVTCLTRPHATGKLSPTAALPHAYPWASC